MDSNSVPPHNLNFMIVFSEAGTSPRTFMEQQIARLTAEAQQNDIKVVHIPESFEFNSALDALCWCPTAFEETTGFVIGYIPSEKRYQEIYDAALQHNIRLINSPEESNRIMDFECFYPLIEDLTPESWIIKSEKDLKRDFEYPVFIKGLLNLAKKMAGMLVSLTIKMNSSKNVINFLH